MTIYIIHGYLIYGVFLSEKKAKEYFEKKQNLLLKSGSNVSLKITEWKI